MDGHNLSLILLVLFINVLRCKNIMIELAEGEGEGNIELFHILCVPALPHTTPAGPINCSNVRCKSEFCPDGSIAPVPEGLCFPSSSYSD